MKDKIPIHPHSAIYTREHNELPEYRVSHRTNIACRDVIGTAISRNYRDNCLSSDEVKEVVAQFGFDRVLYVPAEQRPT